MSRLSTTFVLGYHGCDAGFAKRAVVQGARLLSSGRDYDWLGPGAYFWQSDPVRAREWAVWKAHRGDYAEPAVIGAVIDLGNCLDLTTRAGVEFVQAAHASFIALQQKAELPIPENRNPNGETNEDRVLRFLDCAVIRHLHSMIEAEPGSSPFDTVRGMFTEGGRAYPGSGFHTKSHVQIAVRNLSCVKGVFLLFESD